jgi:DNA modification methylase
MRKIVAEVMEGLRGLPDESVNTVVTSPPYWNQRQYGMEAQLGLEDTPQEYVAKLVAVFREVRRVLRKDGTLWLNLGTSYATKPNGPSLSGSKLEGSMPHAQTRMLNGNRSRGLPPGFKHKDLIGVPWMTALALQADGWWLRSSIIWEKPNTMPESTKSRPTKAHEDIFLLTKSEDYYYDDKAIQEPVSDNPVTDARRHRNGDDIVGTKALYGTEFGQSGKGNVKKSGNKARKSGEAVGLPEGGLGRSIPWEGTTRNKRSVWHVSTQASKCTHHAIFPPTLILPCILAGAPAGGVVLDPFAGSGTTPATAEIMGREGWGIELNPEYADFWGRRKVECQRMLFGGASSTSAEHKSQPGLFDAP